MLDILFTAFIVTFIIFLISGIQKFGHALVLVHDWFEIYFSTRNLGYIRSRFVKQIVKRVPFLVYRNPPQRKVPLPAGPHPERGRPAIRRTPDRDDPRDDSQDSAPKRPRTETKQSAGTASASSVSSPTPSATSPVPPTSPASLEPQDLSAANNRPLPSLDKAISSTEDTQSHSTNQQFAIPLTPEKTKTPASPWRSQQAERDFEFRHSRTPRPTSERSYCSHCWKTHTPSSCFRNTSFRSRPCSPNRNVNLHIPRCHNRNPLTCKICQPSLGAVTTSQTPSSPSNN